FDDPSMNYRYSDMDGMTTRVTRGANMAADRGILVFSSAGNEGLTEWKHIVAPADGTEVIAVGAVDSERKYATFSSMGPGAGGLVKPDLAAMGRGTAVQSSFGSVVPRSGTSFASPVMAGMAACLWQANPDVPAAEIRRIMQIAGHQHNKPDHLLGYGIPDMHLAHMILNQFNVPDDPAANSWTLFPNPFSDRITLIPETAINRKTDFEVFTLSGQLMERFSEYTGSYTRTYRLAHLTPGVYLIRISTENTSEVHKLVKSQ
ncbi:MAG: S8/S53 family peptidase, partial [Bacteroidota bacterium]